MKSIAPYIVETCPECRQTFVVGQNKKSTLKSPSKTCPHCGTETAVWKLINIRKALARGDVIPPGGKVPVVPTVLDDLKTVGIDDKQEGYQAMTAALVGCYDRLVATTPEASRGVIDGVFGNYVKLAKRMLGVVA